MAFTYFERIFSKMQIPVIVCEDKEAYPLVYVNSVARMLLNPILKHEERENGEARCDIRDILRFTSEKNCERLMQTVKNLGAINGFQADLVNHEGENISAVISGNIVEIEGVPRCFVLYINDMPQARNDLVDNNKVVDTAFGLAYRSGNVDDAIGSVLALIGNYAQVSRVYVFEEISEEYTRNTYEWCANGVEPAIESLQNLKKDDYNYNEIIDDEVFIVEDVDNSSILGADILKVQGIKAIILLTLFDMDKPIGYIGFDDCEKARKWNQSELSLLKNISSMIASLINRRNFEQELIRSKDVLQKVTDNIDSIIYATDMETHEIVFLNKAFADSLGKKSSDIIGKICWQTIQKDMDGPCSFCPIQKIPKDGSYTWEFQNTISKRWYLIRDSIIKWVDGRDVHFENGTEITYRKEYEEELKNIASFDKMTGAYNREGGLRYMEDALTHWHTGEGSMSLVFLDIDDLKYVNDTYGHDAGDHLIRKVVEIIRANTRKTDLLTRWGGDEFVLLLNCDINVAERVMDKIDQKMAVYNGHREVPYIVSISHGITELLKSTELSLESVITNADKLMYRNKTRKQRSNGGNTTAPML